MAIPTLSTPNLLLRPWTLDDAEALCSILLEPDMMKYFPPSSPSTVEKAQRYISHQLHHWEERGYGHWAIVTHADGQLAGWNGLEFLPETNETEVAYLLTRRTWGHGYATEAAQAAVAFGFGTCSLPAIIGLVHPGNTGSIRVLEKCGLAFADPITLWNLNMHRYRITRTEFERLKM
jgi:[ribosomal protein S5]-alanine N-acetyltransferase